MQEVLSTLKDTPLPTILAVSGIFFILLSIASQLSGRITVDPSQRKWALLAGSVLVVLGVGLYLGGTLIPRSGSRSSEMQVTYEPDTNRFGGDYKSMDLVSSDPSSCQHSCQVDTQCRAYTYLPPGVQGPTARCWLKNLQPPMSPAPGLVSGIRIH
jgi:PAN domain-containing protein